jgi:hypothetical protein
LVIVTKGISNSKDAQEGRFAKQDMCGLRIALRMAQEMGARLGRGEILLRAVQALSVGLIRAAHSLHPSTRMISENFPGGRVEGAGWLG